MTDSTPTDMSTVLAAITGLSNQMLKMDSDMKGEIKEIKDDVTGLRKEIKEIKDDVNGLRKEIKEIKGHVDKLKRDVHKTRIMSGSLVETNIRSYFVKEYGESIFTNCRGLQS